MIPLPRPLLALLAIGVAACTFTNGVLAIGGSLHPERVVMALALFAIAFLLTITDRRSVLSPLLSGLNAGVSFAMALLCASGLTAAHPMGDAHWYIGAAGCLLVLTMVRRRSAHAWIGAGLVVAQTVVWAGPSGVIDTGAATMTL